MKVAPSDDSWVLKGHTKLTPAVSEFVIFVWTLYSMIYGQKLTRIQNKLINSELENV